MKSLGCVVSVGLNGGEDDASDHRPVRVELPGFFAIANPAPIVSVALVADKSETQAADVAPEVLTHAARMSARVSIRETGRVSPEGVAAMLPLAEFTSWFAIANALTRPVA